MGNTWYKLIYSLVLLPLFMSCNEEEEMPISTRQSRTSSSAFYIQNNKEATKRFKTIMYNDTIQKTERFKIVHISDPHISSLSLNNNYTYPENLIESVKFANQPKLKINTMVTTGDLISNESKGKALLFLQSFIKHYSSNNKIPSLICTGNHDSNRITSNSFFSRKEINEILFSNNTDCNYYYEDIPNPLGGFIRFISLDMLDQPANFYNTLFYAYFSQEQINWLGNVALKKEMTDKHSVIILTHYPFQRYSPDAKTYLCDGDFIHDWSMIPEIIEAYRSRSTINKSFRNKISSENDMLVNFDFTTYKGEFICYLGGHDHCNAFFNINNLENKNKNLLPQRMLLCTNQAPSEIGKVYNRVRREENSITSNSFCLYAIDTHEKNIYITFFGAYKPEDKPDYQEVQCIAY